MSLCEFLLTIKNHAIYTENDEFASTTKNSSINEDILLKTDTTTLSSTVSRYTFILLNKIKTTTFKPHTETSTRFTFIPLKTNISLDKEPIDSEKIVASSSVSSTPFTFLPHDGSTETTNNVTGLTQNDDNGNAKSSTLFTFLPLYTTTESSEAANDILNNSTIINDATNVYITSDIPMINAYNEARTENNQITVYGVSTSSAITDEGQILNSNEKENFDINESVTEISNIIEPTNKNFRKDRQFFSNYFDVTFEMTKSPITTPKNEVLLNNELSTYDKEMTSDFKSTLYLHTDIALHTTSKPGNDLSIVTPVESSTNDFLLKVSSESSVNLEDVLETVTTRFDGEYLHDRQTSVTPDIIDNIPTTKSKTNSLFNYLLINKLKNDRDENETSSMEHKLEKEELAGELIRGFLAVLCLMHV